MTTRITINTELFHEVLNRQLLLKTLTFMFVGEFIIRRLVIVAKAVKPTRGGRWDDRHL